MVLSRVPGEARYWREGRGQRAWQEEVRGGARGVFSRLSLYDCGDADGLLRRWIRHDTRARWPEQ